MDLEYQHPCILFNGAVDDVRASHFAGVRGTTGISNVTTIGARLELLF
jgi:hypothetical protein